MNKSTKYITKFIAALMLMSCFLFNVQAKEPTYNGRPLSEIICCALPDEQYDAFEHLGTNSLPIVLDLMGATDKNMKRVAMRLESRELREQVFGGDEGVIESIRESASKAFEVLGTNAVSAIPRLVKILNENDLDASVYAADALNRVGPKGLVALTNVLSNAAGKTHTQTAVISELVHGDFETVKPMLIGFLKDKSPDIRRFAAEGLSGRDPDMAMPLLVPLLDDTNTEVKVAAASSLSSYGAKAMSAVPKIISTYTNSINREEPGSVYTAILVALKEIDVDAAKQAEAFIINSSPINPYREGYTRAKLANGLELVAGGYIKSEFLYLTNRYLSSAELYDTKTRKSRETGEMTTIRYNHAAVLLANGNVLVIGGEDEKSPALSSAELYDPAAGKWTPTTPMHGAYYGCKAALNPDGTVLVFVAPYNSPIVKYETYDPVTATWTIVTN
jgi:hypothetical protein